MKFTSKVIALIIIAILILSSAYIYYNYSKENENNNDIEPPVINSITGNTIGVEGEEVIINVNFSDNVKVTQATIFFKTEGQDIWSSESILNGSIGINIPSNSDKDWYYYIVINDKAGNGPVGDPSTDGSEYYTIQVQDTGGNEVKHTAFIEDGTATWCTNCPNVAAVLSDLFESGDYDFYYVSLVDDKNNLAQNRLKNDYNVFGYPTVYFDGGYKVVVGDKDQSVFEEALSNTLLRDFSKVKVTVNAEYDNASNQLTINVSVKNLEDKDYSGNLRVYLTEVVSRWSDNSGKPYHYALIDYIINQDVTIDANSISEFEDISSLDDFQFSNLDPANLKIIAVIFNGNSVQRYSDPDNNGNSFDAYFADNTAATDVIPGGNLPPGVGITIPQEGKWYINGKEMKIVSTINSIFESILNRSLIKNTVLFGKKVIEIQAEDDSSVEKVEIYIDEELITTLVDTPYEYSLKKISTIRSVLLKKHTLEVIAYDDQGKTASTTLDFKARL